MMKFHSNLRAFHGQQSIKDRYLGRVREHRAAGEIVQEDIFWENGRGCAIGCTIHSGDHSRYEEELGVPQVLAHVKDRAFDRLPSEDAQMWPEAFLAAIPVGADLSLVWPRFAVWLLIDPADGVFWSAPTGDGAAAIRTVAALYERVVAGDTPTTEEWKRAREAAANAADAALVRSDDGAMYFYATAAASAANVASAAAVSAAVAHAAAAVLPDARHGFMCVARDTLLDLLRAAPVPVEVGA